MNNEFPPQHYDTLVRRELLEDQLGNPEIAMKAHFAQQFGHIALRHINEEISKTDHDRFRELYISKLSQHSLTEDRVALTRDFDKWVDAMLPAALADIYEAKAESDTGDLPEFVSPGDVANLNATKEDRLLHDNLQLANKLQAAEELNNRLMNDSISMRKKLNKTQAAYSELEEKYENLQHDSAMALQEEIYSRGSSVA
jgi:hypothetical protein